MECRRTAAAGILRSPSAPTSNVLMTRRPHHNHRRLPSDCDDHDAFNNNVTTTTSINTTTCTTTQLVDELEQLRTDNFQLRLRVYNAERRVDRLSAAVAHNRGRKRCNSGGDSDSNSCSTDTTGTCSSSDNATAAATNTRTAAAATATAEAAVRTIHDLLTVNRRLLALLAATVSAKAVAVTAEDKRRWRRLRNHINKYAGDQDELQEKEEEEDEDEEEKKENRQNDESDTSTTDSETYSATTRVIDVSVTGRRIARPRSSSPPPPPAEPSAANDEDPSSELARLRGRCRRLERSLQQLVNTELWARNRQIGKLEQQRYVTQVQQADAAQRDRRQEPAIAPVTTTTTTTTTTIASPSATTKGILVKRSPEAAVAASTETMQHSITTPPPVLPDYSEVNFFFSCDEEDDDDDQDEEDSETNTTLSSSSEEDRTDRMGKKDGESVRLQSPLTTSTPVAALVRSRKRHCRRHHRQQRLSSSTESTVATGDYGGDATATTSTATVSRRRRSRPRPRRCSNRCCGRCGVSGAVAVVVADAQVQCESAARTLDQNDDDADQLSVLRRELEARRRENCRLYEMLLKLQRESGQEETVDDENITVDSNSDRAGSPEPYKRAARAVRSRIADLLPPLLSMRSSCSNTLAVDGLLLQSKNNSGCHRNCCEQQQQQLRLLTRLRERIVAYERQELHQQQSDGGEPSSVDVESIAVHHMDRAALMNVALPRAVDRLRRALIPLLQEKPEEQEQLLATAGDSSVDPATANSRPF